MDAPQLDGNVLAGSLSSLFARDATTMTVECGGCDAVALMADTVVERDETAAIVRCRSCTHTLFTVIEQGAAARIRIESLRSFGSATD